MGALHFEVPPSLFILVCQSLIAGILVIMGSQDNLGISV